MSQVSEIAFAHKAARARLQAQVQGRVARLWNAATVQDLDRSWGVLAPAIVGHVVAGQVAAAKMTAPYVAALDRAYKREPAGVNLVPQAFAGVMLDGREVGPALFTGVTTAKTAIRGGMAPFAAFQSGMYAMSVIVSAAIQDMGRQADITASLASSYTYYVRVCDGSSCSRCSILAGIRSGAEAFARHGGCQCGAVPVVVERRGGKVVEGVPRGLFDSPGAIFDSQSRAQQDHAWTKAGAEAIRSGADPLKVVNARRGAAGIGYSSHGYTSMPNSGRRLEAVTIGKRSDGSPLKVFATGEGTSARGAFGRGEVAASGFRRTTTLRLMPEQLVKMADGNTDRLRSLLTRYGYMD